MGVPNSTEKWRFIDSGALDGPTNMAVDQAIAVSTEESDWQGTLRVYAWNPPTISLGFHQSLRDLDLDRCDRDGVGYVFRPTGGRAVFHAAELTYAVALKDTSRHYHREIGPVYEIISRGILAALKKIDLALTFERANRSSHNYTRGELSSLCYASSMQHEIGYQGKKLVGSAQRRFEGSLLQHGSILIGPDHLNLVNYLLRGDERSSNSIRRYMASQTICLNDLSQTPISYRALVEAMRAGFAETMNVCFSDAPLSRIEQQKAAFFKAEQEGKIRDERQDH